MKNGEIRIGILLKLKLAIKCTADKKKSASCEAIHDMPVPMTGRKDNAPKNIIHGTNGSNKALANGAIKLTV